MKEVLLALFATLSSACTFNPSSGGKVYLVCDSLTDKDGRTHYVCDKRQMIGFGYTFK